MANALEFAFRREMSLARAASRAGDLDRAFAHLQRAHVLGQRNVVRHAAVHLRMLWIGRRRGDGREVAGQVLRLAAVVPGYVFGWVPLGNTGGADVSPLRPMAVPADLAVHFEGYSQARTVLGRMLLAALAVAVWLVRR